MANLVEVININDNPNLKYEIGVPDENTPFNVTVHYVADTFMARGSGRPNVPQITVRCSILLSDGVTVVGPYDVPSPAGEYTIPVPINPPPSESQLPTDSGLTAMVSAHLLDTSEPPLPLCGPDGGYEIRRDSRAQK